jgi:hypothetical protein
MDQSNIFTDLCPFNRQNYKSTNLAFNLVHNISDIFQAFLPLLLLSK